MKNLKIELKRFCSKRLDQRRCLKQLNDFNLNNLTVEKQQVNWSKREKVNNVCVLTKLTAVLLNLELWIQTYFINPKKKKLEFLIKQPFNKPVWIPTTFNHTKNQQVNFFCKYFHDIFRSLRFKANFKKRVLKSDLLIFY